ncbi:TolC family outer membrane protein [Guyparkeria halophila]|uniref:TolC family outer membrane protein n=1 Tax=Guyparkeria halophila TaxID=47960 RepID=A0ABZ0Z1I6_9GAMM|nr:TolC family outer membrane protein [Guyparkeria halophila]WQH17225.1 TolC family outer membrane protein [Guyparkeria halophila]
MKTIKQKTLSTLVAAGLMGAPMTVLAQSEQPDDLATVVQQAIESNPDVQSNWHAFVSSGHDIDVARGGYLPTVDAVASVGQESRNYGVNEDYSVAAAEISLTQMLYDGFFTRSEVERLDNAQLVRYYELLGSAEDIALEALTAYQDVLRRRELVDLAQESYQEHLDVKAQIEESSQAGVARGADLEQINARVSLSESNLVTEISNLHDVTARYLRIVGERPADRLAPISLDDSTLAPDVAEALKLAYEGNPSFRAALRDIESSRAAVQRERASYQPRLNLNASYGVDNRDDFGVRENQRDARVGLELRMNLYNGGSDRAAIKSAAEQLNVAKSQRDRACVNMRQTLQIAYNDVRKLSEQVETLNNYRLSADRVRVAYRNQFQIGQRTLLDVLDSENEFFQASRSYVNAEADRRVAIARALAASGRLLESLDVRRDGLPSLADLGAERLPVDTDSACPSVDVAMNLPEVPRTQ